MSKIKIIAVSAQKGGTGKSTTAWALASFLSWNSRVLAIDLDPQGTLWNAIGQTSGKTIYDVLTRKVTLSEVFVPAAEGYNEKLKVVPYSPRLAGLDAEMAGSFDRHFILVDAISDLEDFDFVILDCPSAQGLLTVASLCAANFVLTPTGTDNASYQQLDSMKNTIALIRNRFNPQLRWLPLVATSYEQRQRLDQTILQEMLRNFDVFPQVIPKRVAIRAEMAAGNPCSSPELLIFVNQLVKETNDEKSDTSKEENTAGIQ